MKITLFYIRNSSKYSQAKSLFLKTFIIGSSIFTYLESNLMIIFLDRKGKINYDYNKYTLFENRFEQFI